MENSRTNIPRASGLRQRRETPPSGSPPYDPASMETTFDVVIYHPIDNRDPHHWAIHILSPQQDGSIHQVHDEVGGRGYYVADLRLNIQPQQARLHRVSIFVGRVRWNRLERVRRFVQRWRVNNRSETWNCQVWVVEIIWALVRAGLLRVRWRGLRRLMRMRENWQ